MARDHIEIELGQAGFDLRTATLLHLLGIRIGYKPRIMNPNPSENAADLRFRRKPWHYRTIFSELIAKLKPAWVGANGQDSRAIVESKNSLVILERSETLEAILKAKIDLKHALTALEDFERKRLYQYKCRVPSHDDETL